MKLGFLITARLKSTRLPLKLLRYLNGYTVIERVIQRAKLVVECDDVVLCTSTLNQDLPLNRIALKQAISCFNGDPEDVLARLLTAAKLYSLDYVVCMTADNPLFSIYHANQISDFFRRNPQADYVYTTGLPLGLNVYGMSTNALETVCSIKEIVDTEIWGSLVNQPNTFNVHEIKPPPAFQYNARLTLDEEDDYTVINHIYNSFSRDAVIELQDIYRVLESNTAISQTNSNIVQRSLDPKKKAEIDAFYLNNRDSIAEIKNKIYKR